MKFVRTYPRGEKKVYVHLDGAYEEDAYTFCMADNIGDDDMYRKAPVCFVGDPKKVVITCPDCLGMLALALEYLQGKEKVKK